MEETQSINLRKNDTFSEKIIITKTSTRLAKIMGTGSFLPPNAYSVAELKEFFPSIDEEWVIKNIGVKTRYFVRNLKTGAISHSNSDMTCLAAKKAMERAGVTAEEIDLIVTTTASPDYIIPNMACIVEDKLGARNAASIGIYSGCAGFVNALTIACQFIESGKYNTVLVTGSELLSAYLDFDNPKCLETQTINSTIFGDGAGAIILKASEDGHGVMATHMGSKGKDLGPLIMRVGGSSCRPTIESLKEGHHFWDLNFKAVISQSPKLMEISLNKILESCQIQLSDIDWIIPHQPTLPITQRFIKRLGFSLEKTLITIDEVGNLADACIPVSLDMATNKGKIQRGDLVLLVAAGAGWSYGACLIKW